MAEHDRGWWWVILVILVILGGGVAATHQPDNHNVDYTGVCNRPTVQLGC